mmetsp:Transcript_45467/g.83199  ORF Transcript_45467/g.83199 Transcript_45467/m.83199 type:complete len:412 (+) Transcript_45467:63-1298(+)
MDANSELPAPAFGMKAAVGAFHNADVFQAAARPLARGPQRVAGISTQAQQSCTPSTLALACSAACSAPSRGCPRTSAASRTTLAELADGPYLLIALQLDALGLAKIDATCRLLRQLNRAHVGPWRHLGARIFAGLELDRDGAFELAEQRTGGNDTDQKMLAVKGGRKFARVDWKGRFRRFWTMVPTFRAPFLGKEIMTVRQADEVAYCRCRLLTDVLSDCHRLGVYLEVEVLANPDNLSLAVVDFEAGGRSSITFNPDTGAVIRERKVQELPRKVEGAYIQPLATTPPTQRFQGSIGLYLHCGHLAFFRRCSAGDGSDVQTPQNNGMLTAEEGVWETTGFVTDLAWAEGRQLTPCLAFRDEGEYHVRLVRMGSEPPLAPQRAASAYDDSSWTLLDWEPGTAALEAAERRGS